MFERINGLNECELELKNRNENSDYKSKMKTKTKIRIVDSKFEAILANKIKEGNVNNE